MTGVTDDLPDGWSLTTIDELVDVLDSKRVPINADERALRIGSFPYYGANGQVGTIDDFLFDGDFVLVAEDGGYFEQRGRGVAYRATGKIWVNNHAHILKTRSGIPVPFLVNYLNSINWMPFVSGTTRLKLTQGKMLEVPVPVPPFPEQRRIVVKIEALQTRSRAAREALKPIPPLLEQFRQSILSAAFRGDLTADWREKNPSPKVATADSPEDAPDIPNTWSWKRLADVAQTKGGVTKGRKFDGKSTIQLPYLRVANVQDGYLDLTEIKYIEVLPGDREKYALNFGDILFTEGGDRDKLGRGTIWRNEIQDCIHQNHIFRARVTTNDAIPEFISLASKTEHARSYFFKNASQSVNLASINLTMLSGLPISLPPIQEQKEIVRRVENLFGFADEIEVQLNQAQTRFDLLDQSILAKAFRGELVPQDPSDEPASVLLERIRSERSKETNDKQARGRRKRSNKYSDDE